MSLLLKGSDETHGLKQAEYFTGPRTWAGGISRAEESFSQACMCDKEYGTARVHALECGLG